MVKYVLRKTIKIVLRAKIVALLIGSIGLGLLFLGINLLKPELPLNNCPVAISVCTYMDALNNFDIEKAVQTVTPSRRNIARAGITADLEIAKQEQIRTEDMHYFQYKNFVFVGFMAQGRAIWLIMTLDDNGLIERME